MCVLMSCIFKVNLVDYLQLNYVKLNLIDSRFFLLVAFYIIQSDSIYIIYTLSDNLRINNCIGRGAVLISK